MGYQYAVPGIYLRWREDKAPRADIKDLADHAAKLSVTGKTYKTVVNLQ